MTKAQRYADEAVFQLQLPTAAAVKYVIHNSGVSQEAARQALKDTMTGYKNKKAH
jgi:hypothetical protein